MSVADIVRDYSPIVGLGGVALTLGVNGARSERDRRREIHARAIGAVAAYLEMPYAIRRRRHEAQYASAERTRLSDDFRAVQHELTCCEAMMRADHDAAVRDAYERLVETLRRHAGGEAIRAWQSRPIERDDQMSMKELHSTLEPVRVEQRRFERISAGSTYTGLRLRRRVGPRRA
jgi:hypothetical protein